jgi:hypothetical protein
MLRKEVLVNCAVIDEVDDIVAAGVRVGDVSVVCVILICGLELGKTVIDGVFDTLADCVEDNICDCDD